MSDKITVRFIFTLSNKSLALKVAQYLKSKDKALDSTQKSLFFEAAIAYYLPLALQSDGATLTEILNAVDDCRHSLEKRSDYMRQRFYRQELSSLTAPAIPIPPSADLTIPATLIPPSADLTAPQEQPTFNEDSLF